MDKTNTTQEQIELTQESLPVSGKAAIHEISKKIRALKELDHDIIDVDAALRQLIMKKSTIEAIKKVHRGEILPYRNGYRTRVPDPTKKDGRRTITGATIEEVYLQLVSWYDGVVHIDNLTVDDMYHSWLEYRTNIGINPNTIARDEQHYHRYFEGTDFFRSKFTSVNKAELREFCCSVIIGKTIKHRGKNKLEKGGLTRHEWTSAKSILNGIWNYAVELDYVKYNPLTGMKFPNNLFRIPTRSTKKTEIFNQEEAAHLTTWCWDRYEADQDPASLIPPLMLEIGTRVGECVALQWQDRIDRNHLWIRRSEFKDRRTNALSVQEHTKTYKDRQLPISENAAEILDRLFAESAAIGYDGPDDWIFQRDGERITERQVNYILEVYAEENGLPVKASHKLRKTCGSNLSAMGLSDKQCADYLGNTPAVFQKHYLFDIQTDEHILDVLNRNKTLAAQRNRQRREQNAFGPNKDAKREMRLESVR